MPVTAHQRQGDKLSPTLTDGARDILATACAAEKAARARTFAATVAADVAARKITETGPLGAPDRPARPAKPELWAPRDMPKRRSGKSAQARVALLHALAHIELNAIDLAFDMVARFAGDGLAQTFATDWIAVGGEEALHFKLLAARLSDFDTGYGDLPAHDGLWEAATVTADDVLARLAIVPLVLEARGLDVTPAMTQRMESFGDHKTAALLSRIYQDEITHVAVGSKWFEIVAQMRGLEPRGTWQDLVRTRFKGGLKPPFNVAARDQAGLAADWYVALD
ncbi:MAG: uncharacterized ferritin-like protein (DUF455 family) [Alphaproteobacteria bacterium]|jgi:uncharacterized ferritin-like protein (DUF455 family)